MLEILLGDQGYHVATVGSGEEALAYLELVTPDLILLDLMLPGISGWDITRRIKADTSRPFMPVLLMTARGDQNAKVRGLDSGADDFLVKPLDFPELLARVRAMLRLQRIQRSLQAEQRKTELMLHLTRELGTTLDLEQLLTHFLTRLSDALGAVRASIILSGSDEPAFYSSAPKPAFVPLADILQRGAAGWAIREQQSLIMDDVRTDSRWLKTYENDSVRSVIVTPIIREGRVRGAITLAHHTPGHFTAVHTDLLESVAVQTAVALENAELFELTRHQNQLLEQRTQELQRINDIGQYLTELMRPDQLVRLVAHLIQHTFSYPLVTILLLEGNDLVVRAVAGAGEPLRKLGTRLPQHQGISGLVATDRQPRIVANTSEDSNYVPLHPDECVLSELAVPILAARSVFGVLNVSSPKRGAFSRNDLQVLTALASQTGIALDNAHLFETEKRRVNQLHQVNSLSVAVTAQLNRRENMALAARAVAEIFAAERCGIVVQDSRHTRRASDVPQHSQSAFGPALDYVAATAQLAEQTSMRTPIMLSFSDPSASVECTALQQAGVESCAVAPLLVGTRHIGAILIDITTRTELFTPSDLALLETVAGLLAQVLENAQLYQQVEDERSTLDAVLDGAADPILLISPEDNLLLANRAAYEHLGLTRTAEQRLTNVITDADLLQALHKRRNGYETNGPNEITLPSGETFNVSIAPVQSAHNAQLGRVAVLQDITAIKELERQEQERLRSAFQRYVSPQVVEQILAGGGQIGVPVEREIAVLVSDLRNYTSISEGLEPRVLVEQVLNRYFTAMTEVLYRYEGTVDKFLGDGLIGAFGIPIAHGDDLQRILMAAVEMQQAFKLLQREWRQQLHLDIGMGIGVSYGPAIVGNIGSAQRLDYTIIGDVVNTAQRLNSVAQAGQVIVSHRLLHALPNAWHAPWHLRELDTVRLKGKSEPHLIYEIVYSEPA